MRKTDFATEADLCAAFIAWVKDQSGKFSHGAQTPKWTCYAETAGWDILLVAEDGTQIGIQAKQRFNLKVLNQCLPDDWDHWHDHGPDYRAILIPNNDSSYDKLVSALGLIVFHPVADGYSSGEREPRFAPGLSMQSWRGWHYWSPRKRCALPEYVPDVVAGTPAPVQLTKWKIAALRIVATLELQGYVTRQDFKEFNIDPRRWTGPGGWLLPGALPGQFVRGPSLDFDSQHPEVYAKVLSEIGVERRKRIVQEAA